MPKTWERSQEQVEYLDALIPKLVKARREHRVEQFKNELYEGWFSSWPEELIVFGKGWKRGDAISVVDMRRLGTAIEKRKQQLYNYVRWHGNGKVVCSRTSAVLKKFVSKNRKTLHNRSRKNQKLELYSQNYYDQRFKASIDQEMLDTKPQNESKMAYWKRRMAIYQKWRSLAWQMESDEVKAEIEALYNAGDVSGDDADAEDEMELDETEHPNAGGYGGQLNKLGELLTSFLRELQEETGWAFTILGGGLNREGEVKVVTSHVGKTAAGATFPQLCNNYQGNILQEFISFVKVLHPIEERLLRAQVNNEQNRTSLPNKDMSQSSAADKSCGITGVAPSGGYPTGSPTNHEIECNNMDVDIASDVIAGPTGANLTSSLSSLSLSTPANVSLAHGTMVDEVVLSHVNAVPGLLPSGDFQPGAISFPHPTAASAMSFGYSVASASSATQGSVAPDPSWMSYHDNSTSFPTPMVQAAPLSYDGLSPMSRFLLMTASNDEVAYNSTMTNLQLSNEPPSLLFFNSTNTTNPMISSPMSHPVSIAGMVPQTSYPTSFIRGSGLTNDVSGSEPVNGVSETHSVTLNGPENRALETSAESGYTNQAPVKPPPVAPTKFL
ncbi:hypothetical protein F5887DRAFT_1079216 [Amanita rubescens]|nr:hypothetical protein F5887DRAFT_1079216 [Amanita rubescens]